MKMTNFQLIVSGIFVAFILFGVATFALFTANSNVGVGPVVIWGTAPQDAMNQLLAGLRTQSKSFQNVSYVYKDPATYDETLINAIASGSGPDLFLLSQEDAPSFANKITPVPYNDVSQGTFESSYVGEATLFETPQGILALPFSIDPLVMYWNRDLLTSAGVAAPPQDWNSLIDLAPKLTSLDTTADITESATALGEWSNIMDAKAILSALFMQAGDSIVVRAQDGTLSPTFGARPAGAAETPAASALQFYTQFANPQKSTYSWNRSLPEAQDAFVAGQVGVYFGFASEYSTIAARNPNLSMGVALLPQLSSQGTHLTFGNLEGLAISRGSANPNGALAIAELMTSQGGSAAVSQYLGLPPARVDVTENTSQNAAASVFAQSALIARGWLDPDPTQTSSIFEQMVESVLSGANSPDSAITEGSQALQSLIHSGTQ